MTRKQPKRKKAESGGTAVRTGDRLFAALTHEEIAQLLDACFTEMPSKLQMQVLQQLRPDTRQTIEQVLAPPRTRAPKDTPVSMSKLAKTWSDAWQDWHGIIDKATQEEGPYLVQEEAWEPPDFDTTTFVEDLEVVAETMRPLIQTAFEDAWHPDVDFAAALHEAEVEIVQALPPWIEIHDGFYLEEHLTACLLTGEWLLAMDEGQDAFGFAQRLRQWEKKFKHTYLQTDALLAFFAQLSEADQRLVFDGMNADCKTPLWQSSLDSTYSAWHTLYLGYIEQYAPERYLHTLRPTIPQQWQNGLPIIEDLLAKQDYTESHEVVEECLTALLGRFASRGKSWSPETALFLPLVSGWHRGDRSWHDEKTLLSCYQQTAQGLGQTERANALELQLKAFDHIYDWRIMFDAFKAIALPKKVQQALIKSWRDYIVHQAEPGSWTLGRAKEHDSWWLHWLIDSLLDTRKGPAWFQKQLAAWLSQLSGSQGSAADFSFLRLLSNDVKEMSGIKKHPYPKFYKTVIAPEYLRASDDKSRRSYLKQSASDDVWDQVMAYWQAHLHDWVPGPETAHQSDYTHHAKWMAALHEVAPSACETLLAQWRVDHKRRRNLWKALAKMGLE